MILLLYHVRFTLPKKGNVLQKIIESVKPKNFGVIVRTAAEGKNTAELHEDLLALVETWKIIQNNLKGSVAPAKILSEQTKTTSILRDLLNEDFNRIVVNDRNIFNDTKSYIQRIAPEKADIVSFYHNGFAYFRSVWSNQTGESCVWKNG
jgi:ribonuclease G